MVIRTFAYLEYLQDFKGTSNITEGNPRYGLFYFLCNTIKSPFSSSINPIRSFSNLSAERMTEQKGTDTITG